MKKLLLIGLLLSFGASYGCHRDGFDQDDDTLSTDTNLNATKESRFKQSQRCLSGAVKFIVGRDFRTAKRLFEAVLLYSDDHYVKRLSNSGLGQLYFYGGNGLTRDHKRAEKYFTRVKEDPYFSLKDDLKNLFFLGKIYYLGEDGVQKDFNKAQTFLSAVKEHSDLSDSDRSIIRTYLDDIARYVTPQRSRSFGALLSVADQVLAPEQQKSVPEDNE